MEKTLNCPIAFEEFSELSHVTSADDEEKQGVFLTLKKDVNRGIFVKYPYGQPGDLLWVRESFYELIHIKHGLSEKYYYKADLECQGWKFKYKPSIHMPKDAARIWLMVEEIRVERVQDISDEDARSEGLNDPKFNLESEFVSNAINNGKTLCSGDYLFVWKSLWISINGEASWDANPWVWVVKYRVLSTSGKPNVDQIRQAYTDITSGENLSASAPSRENRKEASDV